MAAPRPRHQLLAAGLAATVATHSPLRARGGPRRDATAFAAPAARASASHGGCLLSGAAPSSVPRGPAGAAAAVAGTALGWSCLVGRSRRRRRRRGPAVSAGVEDSLLNTICGFGDNNPDAIARIQRSCDAVCGPTQKGVLDRFVGDWRCEWNSNTANEGRNTMLKFVSRSVLPSVLVSFFKSYVRVTENTYEVISGFTLAGHETCDAAMCLKGKREKSSGSTCKFKVSEVRVVESDAVTDLSQEMLESAGLTSFKRWQQVKPAESTFVEIQYMGDKMAIFKTEPGVRWVCKRLSGGISDCIPYKI